MKFSVEMLWRSKTFIAVLVLFVTANAWSWLRHKITPVCCDIEMTVGFPVPFHISGGITGAAAFYLLGLLLNITTALTVATVATWIARLIRN